MAAADDGQTGVGHHHGQGQHGIPDEMAAAGSDAQELTTVLYRVLGECRGCRGTGLLFSGGLAVRCFACKGSGHTYRLEERQVPRTALRALPSD